MTAICNIVYWKDKNGVYLSYYDFSVDNSSANAPANMLGKTDYDLYPKAIADQHYEQDLIVLQQARSVSYEISLSDDNISVQISKQPLRAADGEIIGIIANVNNYAVIAAHYKADSQVIKNIVMETTGNAAPDSLSNTKYVEYLRDYLKNIIALIPAHVYWYNPDNILLGCNNLQAKNLGLKSTQEIIGKTLYDLLPAEQAYALAELNMQVMKNGEEYILEEYAIMDDGPGVYLSHKVPIRDAEQNIIGILGISFDITDRKKAEEERLNLVLKASNMGTWSWDFSDDSFTHNYIHHETPYHFNGSSQEAIARAHSADREQFKQAMMSAYQNGTPVDIEYRLAWQDGQTRYIAMRGKVIDNKNGKPSCMVGVCWDITTRKELEKVLYQQQFDLAQIARLNSMGELASTLAHELNQPLASISNYVKGCIIRLKSNNYHIDDVVSAMEHAAKQAARAGEIIHRMKDFIRKGKLYYETVDINSIIQETVSIMRHEPSAATVNIQLELDDQLPVLQLDKIQIGQVVLNLLRNAVEALQQKSNTPNPKIIIKTRYKNHEVCVDVIDNGPGCPSELADKLFTPYFTTKKTGMGMGLAICRTIIEAHSGCLIILPNAESGAWFRFCLPTEKKAVCITQQA